MSPFRTPHPLMVTGLLLVSAAQAFVASHAEAMGGTPGGPTPTSHPEEYCADREQDGYFDSADCRFFDVDGVGDAELYELATHVVWRRKNTNLVDNCPQDSNNNQRDSDADGVGDICEYVDLTAGANHTCGLRADGSVSCWGNNDYGQSDAPVFNFIAIAAGRNHTCGLLNSGDPAKKGTVYCWGDARGNITAGVNGQFTRIRAHGDRSCAIKSNGEALCWGQCGSSACELVSSQPVIDIAPAIEMGAPGSDTPAYGYCASRNTSPWGIQCGIDGPQPPVPTEGPAFFALDGGDEYLCGLQVGGRASCWRKVHQEPPTGDDPMLTPPTQAASYLSVGFDHACSVGFDRQIRCWGSNNFGKSTPPAGRFEQIALGDNHSCAKAESGRIVCWGDHGTSTADPFASKQNKLLPRRSLFMELSANEYVACGVRFDRSLVCSDMALNNITVPAGSYDDVFVGEGLICARKVDGNVLCFDPVTGESEEHSGILAPASRREQVSNIAGKHQCVIRDNTREIACKQRGQPTFNTVTFAYVSRFKQVGLMANSMVCGLSEDGRFVCRDYVQAGGQYEPRSYERFDSLSCSAGRCCASNADHTYCMDASYHIGPADTRDVCEPVKVKVSPFNETTINVCLDGNRCVRGTTNCVERATNCLRDKLTVGALSAKVCLQNPLPNHEAISVGSYNGCTLESGSRQASCWGPDNASSATFQPPAQTFFTLASGTRFSCGLNLDGGAQCWGQMKEDRAKRRVPTPSLNASADAASLTFAR